MYILRKEGVLETTEKFSEKKIEEYIDLLTRSYEKNGRGKNRICFESEHNQEMFLAVSKSNFDQPMYQLNKTISYKIYAGNATLFLFDSNLRIKGKLLLAPGDYISLSSDIPRTMIVQSDFLFFYEFLPGDFEDVDTIWPTKLSGNIIERQSLLGSVI